MAHFHILWYFTNLWEGKCKESNVLGAARPGQEEAKGDARAKIFL